MMRAVKLVKYWRGVSMTILPPMDRLQIGPSLQFSSDRLLPCTTLQDIGFDKRRLTADGKKTGVTGKLSRGKVSTLLALCIP